MLHTSETWPLNQVEPSALAAQQEGHDQTDLQYQARGCGHSKVKIATGKIELEDLDLILRERRLSRLGHVECSSGAVRTACDIQVDERHRPGRPKMSWKQFTENDCHKWKHTTVDPQERKPGDQVLDLLCLQLGSQLEGQPTGGTAIWRGVH